MRRNYVLSNNDLTRIKYRKKHVGTRNEPINLLGCDCSLLSRSIIAYTLRRTTQQYYYLLSFYLYTTN